MSARERVAYLKGLMDGRGTGDEPFWGALHSTLDALCDELDELRNQSEETQEDCRELYALCDGLDADLGEIEERIGEWADEDFIDEELADGLSETDADGLDHEFAETTCTHCGTSFFFHPSLVEDGGVHCPGCDIVVPVTVETEPEPETDGSEQVND